MAEVALPYSPRWYASELHDNPARFKVIVWHRRAGKTVATINHLIRDALTTNQRMARFMYVAPTYKQAKKLAWDYLKFYTAPIHDRGTNESELRVDFGNGARIQLAGADNPDSLRGEGYSGIVMDEYAQMPPSLWRQVIRPALADRKGWAIIMGTPKGRNAFCDLYENAMWGFPLPSGERYRDPDWWGDMRKASETKILPDAELAAARREMSPEEYEQEFECSFQAALAGAYYGKQMVAAEDEGRICAVPAEPRLPVITAWDLGMDDSTAIWFAQLAGRELRIVDFYEAAGVGMDHYAKVLREKPYTYDYHLLPHDVEVRELGSGKSRADTLAGFGIKVTAVPTYPGAVDDGIQAVRNLLPRCWFDRDRCARGIEALRQYQREWDDKLQTYKPRPRHDWASHPADAFRMLAMGLRESQPKADFGAPQSGYRWGDGAHSVSWMGS